MITFNNLSEYKLKDKNKIKQWVKDCIKNEKKTLGNVSYIICDNNYILNINKEYLQHNYFTDIITFDYTENETISGDIFISIEIIIENAAEYKVSIENELSRVMIHGILHLCGYKDKTEGEKKLMRDKENYYLERMF